MSFLISDDGRQISEAAVKNCRRDWKTHFGRSGERERERRSNGTESAKAESFFDHNSCLSLYRDLQKYGSSDYRVAFCTLFFRQLLCFIPLRSQNSALSLAESADVLFMLGRRKEAGSPPPQTLPVSLPPPAKRSDR